MNKLHTYIGECTIPGTTLNGASGRVIASASGDGRLRIVAREEQQPPRSYGEDACGQVYLDERGAERLYQALTEFLGK